MQKVEEVMAIFDAMLQEPTRVIKEAQTFAQATVGVLNRGQPISKVGAVEVKDFDDQIHISGFMMN